MSLEYFFLRYFYGCAFTITFLSFKGMQWKETCLWVHKWVFSWVQLLSKVCVLGELPQPLWASASLFCNGDYTLFGGSLWGFMGQNVHGIGGSMVKKKTTKTDGNERDSSLIPESGSKIPWRRKWQPTVVFLPGESHGWRSLVGYSPWGCKSWTRCSDWTNQPPWSHHRAQYSDIFSLSTNVSTDIYCPGICQWGRQSKIPNLL